ncbi:MAG: hypothetical protein HYS22_05855 [Deltaproteobacteria bacterium]|nr:hypothetical protein [Deltaproteobacteria bacterium]
MIELVNYNNGTLEIVGDGQKLSLPREKAYSLVMAARMHTIEGFKKKLEGLKSPLGETPLVGLILDQFPKLDHTGQWNLKEKFARLRTLATDYPTPPQTEVAEKILLF